MCIRDSAKVVQPEMTMHFEENLLYVEKWIPNKPITAIYFDPEKNRFFIKRFLIENENREDSFIKEGGILPYCSLEWRPSLEIQYEKSRGKEAVSPLIVNAEEFISIKGFKALGNQLTDKKLNTVVLKEKLPYTPPKEESLEEIEVTEEETLKSNSTQTKLDI